MDYKRYGNGGTDVVIPIPRSYADCWQLVRSDYLRYKRTMAPWPKIACYALISRLFAFSLCLRMASYRGWAYPLFKIMHRHLSKKQGLHIDPECHVGYGLYIGHGCGVIVNPTAVLGNNINLSQFTTIGSNEGHAATIGDNVYIGPCVCIVENVHIGCNVTIGAGAVVTKDIPDNATAAGVPAKVISYKKPGRYVNDRFTWQ